MQLATYLINLDGSDQRLAHATAQLEAEGVAFERVAAFDGRGRDLRSLPDFDADAGEAYMGRPMSGGEVGCYHSHMDCLRRFLATDARYCLIFEDDLVLAPDFGKNLTALIDWLDSQPEDWDLFNLGGERKKFYSPIRRLGQHTIIRAHYFPMSATGMIWTRHGAEAFLRQFSHITKPYDNVLRDWQSALNRGLSVVPRMVIPGDFSSDIDSVASRRSKKGRSPLYGWKKQRRLWEAKFRAIGHKLRWRQTHGTPKL